MAYGFGSRIDDDSYAITIVDEDQGSAVTKGEINGVPFESGGGGGSSDFSLIEVTLNLTPPSGVELTAEAVGGYVPYPVIDPSRYLTEGDDEFTYFYHSQPNLATNHKVNVIAYQGTAYIEGVFGVDAENNYYNLDFNTFTTSGDVTFDSTLGYDGIFVVTGSGTITGIIS